MVPTTYGQSIGPGPHNWTCAEHGDSHLRSLEVDGQVAVIQCEHPDHPLLTWNRWDQLKFELRWRTRNVRWAFTRLRWRCVGLADEAI